MRYSEGQTVWLMINGTPVKDKIFCGSNQNGQPIYQLKKIDNTFSEFQLFKTEEDCIYFKGDIRKCFNS